MSRNVYEVFETITGPKYPTDVSMENCLRQYKDDIVVKGLLNMNFNPKFMGFDLPSGNFAYKIDNKQPYGYGQVQLYSEFKRLYIFFNGFELINREKKLIRFIQLLEGLHWKEAEILIAVKDRKLSELFPDINEVLIRTVFPDILPPLTDENGILAAAFGGRNHDCANPNFKYYTKDEIISLSKKRHFLFKFPEQAKAAGLDYLLPDYVKPKEHFELYPELYLEFTVDNTVFGKVTSVIYHKLIEGINKEEIEEMRRHGAKITFTDLDQAANLGLAHVDVRNKVVPVKKPATTTAKKRGRPAKNKV